MDYEAEIGIIIGQGIEQGRVVRAEEDVVKECIFGLVILNDWSGEFSFLFFVSITARM